MAPQKLSGYQPAYAFILAQIDEIVKRDFAFQSGSFAGMLSRYGFGFAEKYESGNYYESLDASNLEILVKRLYYGRIGHITMDERITDGMGNGIWLWSNTAREQYWVGTFLIVNSVTIPANADNDFRGFSLGGLIGSSE